MRRISVIVAVVVAMLAAACSESSAKAKPSGARDVTAPDALGTYAVGRRTLSYTDTARANRQLAVDIVYPADKAAAAKAPASKYVFVPGIEYPSAVAKADVPVAAGKHPVLVYSHGSGGLRFVSSFLTEALASYGFIVIAPDHAGNTALDEFLGTSVSEAQNERNRAADVGFVLSQVLSGKADNPVANSVDTGRVGVIGHSFGGWSAITSVAGWNEIPPDTRVKAIVGMAPYTRNIPDAVLKKVSVPTMLITGTKDVVTPIASDTQRPWDLISGRPLYRVDLLDVGHQAFTDLCAYKTLLRTLPNVPPQFLQTVDLQATQACGTGLLDIAEAQREINRYVIAFVETYVAGNAEYQQYLVSTPPNATVQQKR
jgi:predicted dienelactone hydrolase